MNTDTKTKKKPAKKTPKPNNSKQSVDSKPIEKVRAANKDYKELAKDKTDKHGKQFSMFFNSFLTRHKLSEEDSYKRACKILNLIP